MGCATGIVKFIMFLFNFIFVVGGICMMAAGIAVLLGYKDYQHVVDLDAYKAPPILLIAVGSAIFFIAFMGCCGVLRENNCMMMTYAVFLAILLLVQVGIAVGALMYEKDFTEILHKGFKTSMKKYGTYEEVTKTWDATQRDLHCCGSKTYQDWKTETGNSTVPDSCCKKIEYGCGRGIGDEPELLAGNTIYVDGCVSKVLAALKLKYVVYAAAIIAGIELLGIMFACCLAARFRRKNYV